jgi:Uncharacterized conserved protein (DUF2190)
MYNNAGLIKSFTPTAAIVPFSAVKFGADDNTIALATTATDLVIGFTNEIEVVADDIAKGNLVDVVIDGIAEGRAGAAIVRGSRLTIDATGRVIAAAPAAGANVQIIGIALKSAASADEQIPVLLQRSVMQG